MTLWQRIKEALQDFLARMSESNKNTFGSGTPDCCKVNRGQGNQQRRQ